MWNFCSLGHDKASARGRSSGRLFSELNRTGRYPLLAARFEGTPAAGFADAMHVERATEAVVEGCYGGIHLDGSELDGSEAEASVGGREQLALDDAGVVAAHRVIDSGHTQAVVCDAASDSRYVCSQDLSGSPQERGEVRKKRRQSCDGRPGVRLLLPESVRGRRCHIRPG